LDLKKVNDVQLFHGVVLADGFYEWKKEGRVKKPYRITLQDGKLFAFVGLWDIGWHLQAKW